MLAGLLQPDEGRILFEGVDLAAHPLEVKRELGVVPQEVALYEDLSARENLRFWGGLYGLRGAALRQAVDRVLEQVGLSDNADTRVSTYSGGMKRRLNLSLGLVHSPKVVLMDEPTVGIDPQARVNILDVVHGIAADGTTVLYTTHYLEEAERICRRIAIMDHGKILAEGTLEELERMLGDGELVTVRGSFEGDVLDQLGEIPGVRLVGSGEDQVVLAVSGGGKGAVDLLSRVLSSELPVEGVSIQPPGLNSLFLKLTGRELRD
jgi:ABC-2 type transport system ATP-binding protein